MNRDFTVVELRNFCFIDIRAGDVVAYVCKAGRCGESDVTSSDYSDGAHLFGLRSLYERRLNLLTYAMLTISRRFAVAAFDSVAFRVR